MDRTLDQKENPNCTSSSGTQRGDSSKIGGPHTDYMWLLLAKLLTPSTCSQSQVRRLRTMTHQPHQDSRYDSLRHHHQNPLVRYAGRAWRTQNWTPTLSQRRKLRNKQGECLADADEADE